MSKLTERAAYLRGMAEGMNMAPDTNESRLLLEMVKVLEDMAAELETQDKDLTEMEDYLEDLDADLGEVEHLIYDDEECESCDGDCEGCENAEDEELSFECPNCGREVVVKASDIDGEASPVCKFCGEPFFTDVEEEEEK